MIAKAGCPGPKPAWPGPWGLLKKSETSPPNSCGYARCHSRAKRESSLGNDLLDARFHEHDRATLRPLRNKVCQQAPRLM